VSCGFLNALSPVVPGVFASPYVFELASEVASCLMDPHADDLLDVLWLLLDPLLPPLECYGVIMNAILLVAVQDTVMVSDTLLLPGDLSQASLQLDVMLLDLAMALMTDSTRSAMPHEVFLPIHDLVAEQVSLALLKEGIEEVFNVLHKLHSQPVNSATIQTVRLTHVIDEVLHLEPDLLLEAGTDNPELNNRTGHWSVVVLDPVVLLLFKLSLLLRLIF
jgi:hypothetical protein